MNTIDAFPPVSVWGRQMPAHLDRPGSLWLVLPRATTVGFADVVELVSELRADADRGHCGACAASSSWHDTPSGASVIVLEHSSACSAVRRVRDALEARGWSVERAIGWDIEQKHAGNALMKEEVEA